MSTWIYENAEILTEELKALLEKKDGVLVITTSMHGTAQAGSTKTPLLRMPMAYPTDILKVPNGIPAGAVFLGVMVLPKSSFIEPVEVEDTTK
jgi:hypothetical protein